MVAIKDMEMPSCCMNCGLLGKEEMYCSIYPKRDIDVITVTTTRPNWCPLVEIEEIEKILAEQGEKPYAQILDEIIQKRWKKVVRMDKRQERIERFKSNAEVQRKFGDLQGCLEFMDLVEELEKLEKIEQIINDWNTNWQESQRDLWMYLADIKEVLEQE